MTFEQEGDDIEEVIAEAAERTLITCEKFKSVTTKERLAGAMALTYLAMVFEDDITSMASTLYAALAGLLRAAGISEKTFLEAMLNGQKLSLVKNTKR